MRPAVIDSSLVILLSTFLWQECHFANLPPKTTSLESSEGNAETESASGATKSGSAVCQEPTCKEIAKKFLDRINTAADPCDDFYEHSCGKWIKAQKGDASAWTAISEKTRDMGKKLLNGEVKPAGPAFEAEKKMKELYKQCTDRAEIEKQGGIPITKILEDFNGGWPILTPDWDPSSFDIFDILVSNHFLGNDPFFSIQIMPDLKDTKVNRILLDSMSPFIDTDILLDPSTADTYIDQYKKDINTAIKLLLRDNKLFGKADRFAANITDIVQLETYLGKERLTAVELNNDTIYLNKFTLKTFKDHHKFKSAMLRNITQYLQAFFAVAGRPEAVTDDTIIIVPSLRYWDKLDAKLVELENQGDEGRRRMANYVGWKLIYGVLQYLSKDYQDIAGVDSTNIQGRCLDIIKNMMPLALGTLYVRDVVPRDLKKKATMMVNDIHAGFKELLDDAKWMDKATYEGATQKLAAIQEIVAYPDIMLTNTSAIDSQFDTVTINETFMRSILQTQKNNLIRELRSLLLPHPRYDPLKDTDDISNINAFYSPRQNQLIILAAILRIPFFEASAPKYLNYGAIGYIIGHEITHGFDDTGAKYDSEGARKVWWTKTTVEEYKRRAQTIVQQYSKYTMPTGKVSGELTSGENIADNGGLKAALRGYSRYLARPGIQEPVPPGMEKYTPMQLFFISAAQIWCNKASPEKERLRLMTDEHSPGKWRANGPMSNLPEFAEAFSCPPGSKMNPKTKSGVW